MLCPRKLCVLISIGCSGRRINLKQANYKLREDHRHIVERVDLKKAVADAKLKWSTSKGKWFLSSM